eukprot:6818579-Prorocentrum_lima.AAC.1
MLGGIEEKARVEDAGMGWDRSEQWPHLWVGGKGMGTEGTGGVWESERRMGMVEEAIGKEAVEGV